MKGKMYKYSRMGKLIVTRMGNNILRVAPNWNRATQFWRRFGVLQALFRLDPSIVGRLELEVVRIPLALDGGHVVVQPLDLMLEVVVLGGRVTIRSCTSTCSETVLGVPDVRCTSCSETVLGLPDVRWS